MISYLRQILPEISKYSQKLDDVSLFQNQKWINLDEDTSIKKLYIFRPDGKIIISINGNATIGNWEYIDSTTILVTIDNNSKLLRHKFIDNNFLILNADNTDEYAVFIKEDKNLMSINNIQLVLEYIQGKYHTLNTKGTKSIINKNYTILKQYKSFDLAWGKHEVYEIQFEFHNKSEIFYKGNSSNDYFYVDSNNIKIYRKSFDQIIELVFKHSVKSIK